MRGRVDKARETAWLLAGGEVQGFQKWMQGHTVVWTSGQGPGVSMRVFQETHNGRGRWASERPALCADVVRNGVVSGVCVGRDFDRVAGACGNGGWNEQGIGDRGVKPGVVSLKSVIAEASGPSGAKAPPLQRRTCFKAGLKPLQGRIN